MQTEILLKITRRYPPLHLLPITTLLVLQRSFLARIRLHEARLPQPSSKISIFSFPVSYLSDAAVRLVAPTLSYTLFKSSPVSPLPSNPPDVPSTSASSNAAKDTTFLPRKKISSAMISIQRKPREKSKVDREEYNDLMSHFLG